MNPTRFGTLLIFIYLINVVFLTPVMAENNSITPQYVDKTNISEIKTPADQHVEQRLDLLESRVNDLAQSTKKQEKDIWDKTSSVSPLMTGIFAAVIAAAVTYCYQKKQLGLERLQTVQKFMTFLSSGDNPMNVDRRIVRTTIRSILELHPNIAFNLAEMYFYYGGIEELDYWANSKDLDENIVNRAKKILEDIKRTDPKLALLLFKDGYSHDEVTKEMENAYTKRYPKAEPSEVQREVQSFMGAVDYIRRSKRKNGSN